MKKLSTLLCAWVCVALAVTPAHAFDLGNLKDLDRVKKAISIGGKVVKANREINQEEEIEIGKGVAAQVMGAAPLVDGAPAPAPRFDGQAPAITAQPEPMSLDQAKAAWA